MLPNESLVVKRRLLTGVPAGPVRVQWKVLLLVRASKYSSAALARLKR